MSGKKEQDEPTMEEILASIRRIISEEGEPVKTDSPSPAPAQAAAEDDILELTEVVEDDEELTMPAVDLEVTEDDLAAPASDEFDQAASMAGDAPDAPGEEPAPEPGPAAVPPPQPSAAKSAPAAALMQDVPAFTDMVDPAEEHEAIMSEDSSDAVRDTFGQLSDLLVAGYAGSDKTLEGMVREMLKPMLKTWLDKNLPPIVERAVAREIARLARVKRP